MQVTETLNQGLKRAYQVVLPAQDLAQRLDSQLVEMKDKVRINGFRPGKVPMNIVAQRYGYTVHYEVMNDKVGEAFAQAANEAKLRVAGQPRISEKDGAPEGQLAFDAVFEVYPEVKLPELATLEVERVSSDVSPAAIDKTIDILRKQRRTFGLRALDAAAADGDRVQIDFEGKIDGEVFQGGKADDFQFIVGEGQMLKEFEEAVVGMKPGGLEEKFRPLLPAYMTMGHEGMDMGRMAEVMPMPRNTISMKGAAGPFGEGFHVVFRQPRSHVPEEHAVPAP